jgi:hypothetical protein
MTRRASDEGNNAFARLQESLGTALDLARELASNELLGRLITVFRNMPLQDRPVIIGILEREVTGRMLSRATEKAVQQETHVNPNARLYMRAHSSAIDSRIFDRDEMMIADVRAMRIAGLIRHVPQLYELWKDALREAMQQVDEATRANAEQLLRDGLAAIAEVRAAELETEPTTDTSADGTTGTKRP